MLVFAIVRLGLCGSLQLRQAAPRKDASSNAAYPSMEWMVWFSIRFAARRRAADRFICAVLTEGAGDSFLRGSSENGNRLRNRCILYVFGRARHVGLDEMVRAKGVEGGALSSFSRLCLFLASRVPSRIGYDA